MNSRFGERRSRDAGSCSEKTWTGFTLIELLVVITVIVLLAALLMPVLRSAREAGRRAVCMGHLRQMQLAWQTYAEDHGGFIVLGSAFQFLHSEAMGKPWLTDFPLGTPQNLAEAEAWMRTGALAPYVGDVKVYRCPSQCRYQTDRACDPRSLKAVQWYPPYGIVGPMNLLTPDIRAEWEAEFIKFHGPSRIPACITHLSQLSPPGASRRMVFLDTGYPSLAQLGIGAEYCIINPDIGPEKGWTRGGYGAPIHHSKGTCMSFADGHVEYWKWKDPRTVAWSQAWRDWFDGGGTKPEANPWVPQDPDNEDYIEFYRAIWGRD
jgi:prepilin-type N-terminal cleavage/methylation domain-containing protein/prepilin-type processing-associated H-X9-DG protein